MRCKNYKDIVPSTPSGEVISDCGNLSVATGGIHSPILLFNADDISNLEFYNDYRFDENLLVETIVTDASFFNMDGSGIDYKETITLDNKHQHTLAISLNNIHPSLESVLFDLKNGRYIVCFRPKGEDTYRLFGWKEGAVVTIELVINESSTQYNCQFQYESIYPLFQVNADNFNLKNKYYNPIWQPLYNISYCELNGGTRTGFAIAEYVVKVNQAGQALDRNNQLSSITGLPQVAYKYINTASDNGFEIIGTYNDSGSFDGHPVKVYDETLCPPNAVGTIDVNPKSINLNSSVTSANYTVTTSNAWEVKEQPVLVTVTPSNGTGNTSGVISRNNSGGTNILLFQNKTTKEIIQVLVNIYLIKVTTNYNFTAATTSFTIPVTSEGGSNNFTYTTPSGLNIIRNGNNLNCTVTTPTTNEQNYTITITHADDATESKVVNIKISGLNTTPNWVTISRYCKLV